MDYKYILREKQDHLCWVTLNHPQTLNALNSAVLNELGAVFDELEADKEIYVVILTGAGRSFVAGADISEMSCLDTEAGRAFGRLGAAVFRKIELSEKIVIAAVNGYALGGGCELAMACDIRIASVKAKFAQPEVGLGIIPGFSGTQRLPRLVGLGKAKELIYTGLPIDGAEAFRIGLVNKVTEPDQLMQEAKALALAIASRSPLALKYAKEAINRGIETDIETGIAIENSYFGLCFGTTEQKTQMQAFLEKKK